MSKVIKNVKVDWVWTGDSYSLMGFNIAITPTSSTPDNGAVAITDVGNVRTYTFNNVTLDDAITYTAWVQAIYDGKDSSWINTSDFSISDDGKATIETRMSNVANLWRSSKDPNAIDGGDIYAGSVTADKINAYGLTIYNSGQGNAPSFSVSTTGDVNLSGNLKSFNYSSADKTGWSITQDGNAVLNQATVRGSILLPNAGMTDQNVYRIWAGQSNAYTSWTTTISSASVIGAKTLTLTSISGIKAGVNQLITIGTEQKMIINLNTATNVATLDSALTTAYTSGTSVTLTLLAPFTVAQDGTVYAKQGNFGGTFSGSVNVGNIHISDIDPNPSSTAVASFIMNTDGETRTVVKLTESNGYIDTPFIFGNDIAKYVNINNSSNLFEINGNSLNISQFNKNLIPQSITLGTIILDANTSKTLNATGTPDGENNGIKLTTASGATSNNFRIPNVINSNDTYTVSFWYKSGMAGNVSFAVDVCDKPATSFTATQTWQKGTLTVVVDNYSSAVYNFIDFNITGASTSLYLWQVQCERSNISSPWGVTMTETKDVKFPNRVDKPYMQFKGTNFNFDIKTDNTFYFQSNSSASTDFKFAKESATNAVSVFVDGILEVNNLMKLGKLIMQKKTDTGNQGIDFIFT